MEILGSNFFCNLVEVHMNKLVGKSLDYIEDVFYHAGLEVAALLSHEFNIEKFRYSREIDPIVGVSFTGLFDFFVMHFGPTWLQWWEEGRPSNWYLSKNNTCVNMALIFKQEEANILRAIREAAEAGVKDYCEREGLKVPNRCTTVQPAGCGDKNTLRTFAEGLLYPDEILEENSGETEGLNLHVRNKTMGGALPSTTKNVTKGIANNLTPIISIKTKNGRNIRVTPNHMFKIGDKWVQAEDLKPGISLTVVKDQYESVGTSYIHPDMAYVVGCIFGNGSTSVNDQKHRVRICHGNPALLEYTKDVLKEFFQLEDGKFEIHSYREGLYEISCGDKEVFDYFLEHNVAKLEKSATLERVPLGIRKSSKEAIIAFIAGFIDTDGCISQSNHAVTINSASYNFLHSLQQVGEAVGLVFSLKEYKKSDTSFSNKPTSFWLTLSRMESEETSIDILNKYVKKGSIEKSTRFFRTNPYEITEVSFDGYDYTYDFAVDGDNWEDSWAYWGGIVSHNTKSLLTGASPGWHPPKGSRFLRRITFAKDDAVALACIDYGYNVIPAQKDKDEIGNLLNDPFDPRCTEWLVEIPVEVEWANLEGADQIDTSKFSVKAQFDFYMQVQKHYTTHNTSATLEYREEEIDEFAQLLYESIQNDDGYISAAMMARFDANETFPRLPFEPITKERFEKEMQGIQERRKSEDFYELLMKYDTKVEDFAGPSGCDGSKCLLPER